MASNSVSRARHVRKQSTEAEKTLWRHVRSRQLAGYRFRRQAPLGKYIADFLCYERGLVIEIDGGQHQRRTEADKKRTNWLETQGFRVIRFWINQVLAETEAVLEAILREMQGEDSPSPPHRVRGRL